MAPRLLLPVVALSLLHACSKVGDSPRAVDGGGEGAEEATLVLVAPLQEGRVESVIERTGDVQTLYEVPLFAELSGRVEAVLVDVSDRVEVGTALLHLDAEEARLEERSSAAAVTEARERVAQRQLELEEARDQQQGGALRAEQARREHARTEELFAQRLVTQRELEEKKLALDEAEANERAGDFSERKAQVALDQAQNAVESARIQEEKAQLSVRQHTLRAPFAGVISERLADPGAVVGTSSPLLTLVDDRNLVIPLKITQKDITRVAVGQEVEIRAREAFPDRVFKGHIDRLSPVVEQSSGSQIARVKVVDGVDELRPGVFVQCRVLTRVDEDRLLVPRKAVFYQDQKPSFFVVKDGVARRVVFEPGPGTEECFQIVQHLGPALQRGDPVVVIGKDRLDDGDAVRSAPASAPAGSPSPSDGTDPSSAD